MNVDVKPNPASRVDVRTVAIAVLGGIYLAEAVAWLFAVRANPMIFDDKFQESVARFTEFFAITAAPLWFFTVVALTHRQPARRILWLIVGAVVAFPLPLVIGVVV